MTKPPIKHSPSLQYNGLTIVLSNASRFDSKQLLSGTGGMYFSNDCLYKNGVNRFQCEIRSMECKEPLLPNTKVILALGQEALDFYGQRNTNLGAQRGSPIMANGIYVIASYLPQEAVDRKNYEAEFNEELKEKVAAEASSRMSQDDSAISEKKRHGKTNQKNYKFWLAKDVEKAVNLLTYKIPIQRNENYIIYPNSGDVINALRNNKNQDLYFDVETDVNLNITCFSFAFNLSEVFVLPVVTHTYSKAYADLPAIFKALAIGIRDNTLVAHNGAGFDFLVLAHKYRIPIGHKTYDTLLAQNRIYPGLEKSLGHCLSLPWLYEPYHKDEANFAFGNKDQAMQLWRYCGKDVSSLIKLKEAQLSYAKSKIGLLDSISSVNSYSRSYIITTLTGIRYDKTILDETMNQNDRLMMQCLRWLKILIGEKYLKLIRGTGKSSMPGSNRQCCKYFHELLKYPVQGRTLSGGPTLDKKALFKLKLKIENPIIDIIIFYRQLAKESGSLKFIPLREETKND